jgi:tetratricopeptide (TPR) repeat protein
MPETIHCPDCGTENPAGAESCTQCNYPLRGAFPKAPSPEPAPAAATAPAPAEPAPAESGAAESAPTDATTAEPAGEPTPAAESTLVAPNEPEPGAPVRGFSPGPRPLRPRRPRPEAMQPIQMQLWLFAGAAVVMGIVYFAAQGFWHSNAVPVVGAQPQQQQRADLARTALERDSTNLAARIELANVLYDTGNWSEAIIHYRSAERLDPKRATTSVDLGVCYYNLGQFAAAESLFQHALSLDAHQVFALFNLGIVAESQKRWDAALDYFHRAMRAGPPDAMKAPLEEHLQAVMAKTGKVPPPLPN